MANEKNTSWIWILILILIILYLIYAYNANCINGKCDPITRFLNNNFGKWFASKSKEAYKECLDKNKLLAEGSECFSCTPPGSKIAVFMGIIKDGKCIAKSEVPSEPIRGKIKSLRGANIYQSDPTHGMKQTSIVIPAESEVGYVAIVSSSYCDMNSQICYAPTNFYQLTNNQGFLRSGDVQETTVPS